MQTYLTTIQDLLLNHRLGEPLNRNSSSSNVTIQEVRELARARTLVAIRGLDPERKGILVQFIYGANLIISPMPIIDLSGAILRGADLSTTSLYSAALHDADLSGANLSGANLSGANLSGAFLAGAQNLTQQQLDQASTCKGATLPQGLTCNNTL